MENNLLLPPGIKAAPSPWLNLPVSIWILPFYSKAPLLGGGGVYATLEAESGFGDERVCGRFMGGLGTVQVVRYHDSPTGPYDELLIVPGKFEVGEAGKKKEMLRVTRIYVSERGTMWNGRNNWNIPKHLAAFTFTTTSTGSTHLTVRAPNTTSPFFQANLTPFKYIPAIPFSTNSAKWIGMDLRLAQPPLPSAATGEDAGDREEGADCLCGTKQWKVAMPEIWGGARACWADVDFANEVGEETALLGGADSSSRDKCGSGKAEWPKYRPWSVGLFIEEGRINFRDGDVKGVTL